MKKPILLSLAISSLSSLHAGNDNLIALPQTSVNYNDRIRLTEIITLNQIDPLTNRSFKELIQEASAQQTPWTLIAYNICSPNQLERAYATEPYITILLETDEGKRTILSIDKYHITYNGETFVCEYRESITDTDLACSQFATH